jgi:bacillaene synthase trans-acting acyltransferase
VVDVTAPAAESITRTGSTQNLPVVFLFAGQGSQYFRMGAEMFRKHPVFREWLWIGDRMLHDRFGFSVIRAIQGEGRQLHEPFDCLRETHPAIFLMQYALAKVLEHHGVFPDRLVGVSLGEIVAMTVAEMLPFEAALMSVAAQPQVFAQTCSPGGMMAVLADPQLHTRNATLAAHSEMAGISTDRHFVLAGPTQGMHEIAEELERLNVLWQMLPVPFAFHSRWIESARQACQATTENLRLLAPRWPVFSTALQERLGPGGFNLPASDLFWRILRGPMRLRETLAGIEMAGGAIYVDLSPSGTLAGRARQMLAAGSPSRFYQLLTPFGEDLLLVDKFLRFLDRRGYPPLPASERAREGHGIE